MKEIEYKYLTKATEKEFIALVKGLSSKKTPIRKKSEDIYFKKEGSENTRIRIEGKTKTLTTKTKIKGNEVRIEKNVDIKNMKKTVEILDSLGYTKAFSLQKNYTIFNTNTVEIAYIVVENDPLKRAFIEIEYKGSNENGEEILAELEKKIRPILSIRISENNFELFSKII